VELRGVVVRHGPNERIRNRPPGEGGDGSKAANSDVCHDLSSLLRRGDVETVSVSRVLRIGHIAGVVLRRVHDLLGGRAHDAVVALLTSRLNRVGALLVDLHPGELVVHAVAGAAVRSAVEPTRRTGT